MGDSVQKISKIQRDASKIAELDNLPKMRINPNEERFNAAMERTQVQHDPAAKKAKANLMDEIRDLNRRVDFATKATPEKLQKQVHQVVADMENVKQKLKTPGLDRVLSSDQRRIFSNKLDYIDDKLKSAMDRAGVEYEAPDRIISTAEKPIDRFIGLLTHGQGQLDKLGFEVAKIGAMDKEMRPAAMLALQVKVGYMQQEIELFASLLNKSLESIKTIMNVQV